MCTQGQLEVSSHSARITIKHLFFALLAGFHVSAEMTVDISSLDAHEQPSDELRAKWKAYSKTEAADLLARHDIDDLRSPKKAAEFMLSSNIPTDQLRTAFNHLSPDITSNLKLEDAPIYYHPLLPGQS